MVTLERGDGSEVTFQADAAVRNLAQVEVGDEVTATYYESLAYESEETGHSHAWCHRRDGNGPGATRREARRGRSRYGHSRGHHHQYRQGRWHRHAAGPAGRTRTFKARNPRNLERVAVGDLVEITYTEAVAVSVEKPRKP